jgi:AraC-like DNA-binding protein
MKAENDSMIETLANSNLFAEYERSFGETTKLPIALRPVESWQLPLHRKKHENSFCALMASNSRACAVCLQLQEKLAQNASNEAAVVTCAYGLSEFAAPVRQEGKVIGFLQSGQVLQRQPTAEQFKKVSQQVRENGIQIDRAALEKAFFKTPVFSSERIGSILRLLTIFAEHLSMKADQVAVQRANAELPQIAKAKNYVREHVVEELSLAGVAKAVNMSTFYFCKMFSKYAGMHFTKFVSQVRTERARNLLLNPNLQVSEIAYEVGFQSLTHFNRVFKKMVGLSPTEFRLTVPKAS